MLAGEKRRDVMADLLIVEHGLCGVLSNAVFEIFGRPTQTPLLNQPTFIMSLIPANGSFLSISVHRLSDDISSFHVSPASLHSLPSLIGTTPFTPVRSSTCNVLDIPCLLDSRSAVSIRPPVPPALHPRPYIAISDSYLDSPSPSSILRSWRKRKSTSTV